MSDLEAAGLFAEPVRFEKGVTALRDLPDASLPEVAFAGRSNVGKSSLINALVNRKGLARASGEPGRTRELNFFVLGEALRLVDLPGYGYAKASKDAIARWSALTRDYLRGRPGLSRAMLLLDARHGVKPPDERVMDLLDQSALVYQIVLTKADKLKPTEIEAVRADVSKRVSRRPAAHPHVLAVSAHTGEGLALLRDEIGALATPRGPDTPPS